MTIPVVVMTSTFIAMTIPTIAIIMTMPPIVIVAPAFIAMVLIEPIGVSRGPFSLLDDRRPSHAKLKSICSDEHLRPSTILLIELPTPQGRLTLQIVLIPQRSFMRFMQRINFRRDRPD